MNKFGKRIQKFIGEVENCLVIGQGFGKLENISETFNTVFVFSENIIPYKAKNIIQRESFDSIFQLSSISVIFFDKNQLEKLRPSIPLWIAHKPFIIIEGNDVIDREKSKDLHERGYRAVEMQGTHHIWSLKK